MPIYSRDCTQATEAAKIADEISRLYHDELIDAGVTIDILAAFPTTDEHGEPVEEYALKLHGYPAYAVVKINSYKLRVQGHADAEITIDGYQWDTLRDDQRRAITDHELTHLEIRRDNQGAIKTDDLMRPKLKMRLHDTQVGWFKEIAERHKLASVEVQQAIEIFTNEESRQLYLPGI
jgi:hypothetical protein